MVSYFHKFRLYFEVLSTPSPNSFENQNSTNEKSLIRGNIEPMEAKLRSIGWWFDNYINRKLDKSSPKIAKVTPPTSGNISSAKTTSGNISSAKSGDKLLTSTSKTPSHSQPP
jgi:hypothetical protein